MADTSLTPGTGTLTITGNAVIPVLPPHVEINPSHAAYAFLQKVWAFKEGGGLPRELLGLTPVTVDAGSFVWTQEASGFGITLTTADIIGLGIDLYPTSPDITILIRKRATVAPVSIRCAFGYAGDSAGSAQRCSGVIPSDDNSTIIFDFGGTSSGTSRLLITGQVFNTTLDTFVIRVNASEIRMWRTGTDIGHTTVAPPPSRTNNGTNSQLNNGFGNNAGNPIFVDLFAIYTGALSDAQCAALSLNPLGIFMPMPGTGTLTLTGFAPGRRTDFRLTPGTGTLTLTGGTPSAPVTIPLIPGTGSLNLTGFAPGVSKYLTPGTGSLALTGSAPARNITLPFSPSTGALALTGSVPTLVLTHQALRHTWHVYAPLNAPLNHIWIVVPIGLYAPLHHTWTVHNPMVPLHHIWRVVPNVTVLGDEYIQKPVQEVIKTP